MVPPANFDANSVHFHADPVYFALDSTHFNTDPANFVLNPDFFFWLNFVCIRLILVLRLLILIYSPVDTTDFVVDTIHLRLVTAYFRFSLDPAHFVADSAHLDYLAPFDADPVYLGLNPADFGLYPTADPARIGLYPTHFGRSGSKSDSFGCGFGSFELNLTYF